MCYFDTEKEITNVSSLYVATHFQSKDCMASQDEYVREGKKV